MLSTVPDVLGGVMGPPLAAGLVCACRRGPVLVFVAWWVFAAAWVLVFCAVVGDGAGAVSASLSFAAAVVAWFRNRRRRRRAPRFCGAKSRGRVAALVRRARTAARRAALRPVPGGAR